MALFKTDVNMRVTPKEFGSSTAKFSLLKNYVSSNNTGRLSQKTLGYCWRTYFNVSEPLCLHQNFQVLVSSKWLYTERYFRPFGVRQQYPLVSCDNPTFQRIR
jgi:hypothetical protein